MSATASVTTRYRLDDLRRLGSSLASGLGVAPARASALATHLLWFDAAGASSHGIASLPTWLDRLDRKEVDPTEEGRAGSEHAGTAVFDARHGLAPLALEKAAGIASEKARDVGVGVVHIRNLGPSGPPAPAAASLAIGPYLAAIAGPGPSFTLALPMPEGLPVVFDSSLGAEPGAGRLSEPFGDMGLATWVPWLSAISGGDGWVVLALAISTMGPLTSFRERVAALFRDSAEGPGRLRPESWEARRREARERGVSINDPATALLKGWADRLDVPWPTPMGG